MEYYIRNGNVLKNNMYLNGNILMTLLGDHILNISDWVQRH